jgi:hypothetical protein
MSSLSFKLYDFSEAGFACVIRCKRGREGFSSAKLGSVSGQRMIFCPAYILYIIIREIEMRTGIISEPSVFIIL